MAQWFGEPVYCDGGVTLYNADSRRLYGIPRAPFFDLVVTDPPYGETSLQWDRWPDWKWIDAMWPLVRQMWCFGSMRMFTGHWPEFVEAGWKFAQDVVWEKHNGSGFHNDRFRRVHEHALHFYNGSWAETYHETPVTLDATRRSVRRGKRRPNHMGHIEYRPYQSEDGGPRLMTSVFYAPSMHGKAIHPTEKPLAVLEPLIHYSCPPGGLVLDPFAGSASTLIAARNAGRRAVGIEARPDYCEAAIARLAQSTLDFGESA